MQIIVENLSKVFNKNTSNENQVLANVNVNFSQGEMVAIIGHSGSGKTTFVEHLNGISVPQSGSLYFKDIRVEEKKRRWFFSRTKNKNPDFKLERMQFSEILDKLYSNYENSVLVIGDFLAANDWRGIVKAIMFLKKFVQRERFKQLCFLFDWDENFVEEFEKFSQLDTSFYTKLSIFLLTFLEPKLIVIDKEKSEVTDVVQIIDNIISFYSQKLFLIQKEENNPKKWLQKITKTLSQESHKEELRDCTIEFSKPNLQFLRFVRMKVGIVYQFAEYQLFKETVEEDIMFGPVAIGKSKLHAKYLARKYINIVGLDETLLDKSPFNLSGGQKRRVAIAGILAMEPDYLIFDEPTVGLDPEGTKSMLEVFKKLNQQGKTVIICTHDLDNVLSWADRVLFFREGKLIQDDSTFEVLRNSKKLIQNQLKETKLLSLVNTLEKECGIKIGKVHTIKELGEAINKNLKGS